MYGLIRWFSMPKTGGFRVMCGAARLRHTEDITRASESHLGQESPAAATHLGEALAWRKPVP